MHRGSGPKLEVGFTLIEILIALLVLSVGLAGLAALYLTSLGSVHSALQSSVASSVALDFEERLWVEVGRIGDGTCPDVAEVISELQAHWTAGQEGLVGLPGLEVLAGPAVSGSRFVQLPITVTWCEGRFDDAVAEEDDCPRERFAYVARVYCDPMP